MTMVERLAAILFCTEVHGYGRSNHAAEWEDMTDAMRSRWRGRAEEVLVEIADPLGRERERELVRAEVLAAVLNLLQSHRVEVWEKGPDSDTKLDALDEVDRRVRALLGPMEASSS